MNSMWLRKRLWRNCSKNMDKNSYIENKKVNILGRRCLKSLRNTTGNNHWIWLSWDYMSDCIKYWTNVRKMPMDNSRCRRRSFQISWYQKKLGHKQESVPAVSLEFWPISKQLPFSPTTLSSSSLAAFCLHHNMDHGQMFINLPSKEIELSIIVMSFSFHPLLTSDLLITKIMHLWTSDTLDHAW